MELLVMAFGLPDALIAGMSVSAIVYALIGVIVFLVALGSGTLVGESFRSTAATAELIFILTGLVLVSVADAFSPGVDAGAWGRRRGKAWRRRWVTKPTPLPKCTVVRD